MNNTLESGKLLAVQSFVKPAEHIIDRLQSALHVNDKGQIEIRLPLDFNELVDWNYLLTAMKGLCK